MEAHFTVKEKSTLNKDFKLKDDILWVRNMSLGEIDAVGLICDDEIVNFVAWGKDGVAPDGPLYNDAILLEFGTQATLWKRVVANHCRRVTQSEEIDFQLTPRVVLIGSILEVSKHLVLRLRRQNFYFARINEVLLIPDPASKDIRERRKFVEIHSVGSYGLEGCSLVNDLGTFRVDFDINLYRTFTYFVVKEKDTLDRDFKYVESKDILWAREMQIGLVDGLALVCDDNIIDYVAWGKGSVGPSGSLHSNAVASGSLEWYRPVRPNWTRKSWWWIHFTWFAKGRYFGERSGFNRHKFR